MNSDNTFNPIEDDVQGLRTKVHTGWSDYDNGAVVFGTNSLTAQVHNVSRSALIAEFDQIITMQSTAAIQAEKIAKMEETVKHQSTMISMLMSESSMWRERLSTSERQAAQLESKVSYLENELRVSRSLSTMDIQHQMDAQRVAERIHREDQDRRFAQMMQRMVDVEQSPYGGMKITCGPSQVTFSDQRIGTQTTGITSISSSTPSSEIEQLISVSQTGIRNSSTATRSMLDIAGPRAASTYDTMTASAMLEDIQRSLTAAMSSAVVTAVPKMTADWLNIAPTVTHRRLLG